MNLSSTTPQEPWQQFETLRQLEDTEQSMNTIPNWFRWLIIIVATLIMCACRSPLQDPSSSQPIQSVLVRNTNSPLPEVQESILSTLSNLQTHYELDAGLLGGRLITPQPHQIQPYQASVACEAPIIQRRNDNRFHVQNLEQAAGQEFTQVVKAPVYFHVDDQLFQVQQTQALAEDAISPFIDDPVPPAEVIPSAPIVDPSFVPQVGNQQPPPANTVVPLQHPYPESQPLSAGEVIGGPVIQPIVDYVESLPLAPTDAVPPQPLPAPFDYLPQAEIPCNVAPEKWALPPCEAMGVSYRELTKQYPDEYICDGGDAVGEVQVLPDWSLRGLDPEDTVGHFDTVDNKVEVEASNRVCIYAPRFAAVRKVTSPFQNEKYDQALIEQRDDLAITQQQEVSTVSYDKTVAAKRHLRIQPAVALQRDVPGITGVHSLPVRVINKDFSAHEDFRVMKIGIHKQADKPQLANYTTKAITWAADKAVQVVIDGVAARVNVGHKSIESVHIVGDNRPAKLRVIKTASVSDALPGEEVEFTLRFDNIGYQPMGNVTIIDNLTTRLEYLKDTELCSLENNFVVDDNEVESLTLRWEIIDPIPAGKGGLIRFKCRVR